MKDHDRQAEPQDELFGCRPGQNGAVRTANSPSTLTKLIASSAERSPS